MARQRKQLRPRKKPTQQRSQFTVEQVLEAAAHVFERQGYAAGTTNHIAQRAGVSIGTLYQYFPNKDAILVELARRHLLETAEMFSGLLEHVRQERHDLEQSLRHLVNGMVQIHQRQRGLHRVLLEQAPRPASIKQQVRDNEELAVSGVVRLLDQFDEVSVDCPRLAAHVVVQTMHSLTHHFVVTHPDGVAAADFVDQVVLMLERYLAR